MPELAQRFASLERGQQLIASPRSAADFYANARIAEQRGEALAARRYYLELARLDIDAVDAWSRFATVVRVQDGRAGAREAFASVAPKPSSLAYELVAATLYDDVERRRRVEAFTTEHPTYGPGWYLLADDYSETRLGTQTIAERQKEAEALGRFLAAEEDGDLVRHFMDPAMLGDWIETARRRKLALDQKLQPGQIKPAVSFLRSNSNWSVSVQLPEAATGFSYRLGKEGAFETAGTAQAIDPRTGKPFPNTLISIVPGREPKEIYIKYLDLRGQERGPFVLPFDPAAALADGARQALSITKGAWIAFGGSSGSLLMYTSHLASYRCGFERASFGLDGAAPTTPIALPACDPANPYSIPSNFTPYLKIPGSTRSVTVQVAFRDGTTLDTVIPRP